MSAWGSAAGDGPSRHKIEAVAHGGQLWTITLAVATSETAYEARDVALAAMMIPAGLALDDYTVNDDDGVITLIFRAPAE